MSPVYMLNFRVLRPHHDFTLNRLGEPTPEQAAALAELAADPGFDPGGYRGLPDSSSARYARCKVCLCPGAPQNVCGYCRSRVRTLRARRVAAAAAAEAES